MKERPILFSGPMVTAILSGTKTQTRRVVKCDYTIAAASSAGCDQIMEKKVGRMKDGSIGRKAIGFVCGINDGPPLDECIKLFSPYGQPGDRLWVRETFAFCVRDKCGPIADSLIYRADGNEDWDGNWKPSIFMPREASRITLEVTGIRVERLQDISEADVLAEGCKGEPCDHARRSCKEIGCRGPVPTVGDYRSLWDSINAKTAPWASNPWVWVVEFKRSA